MADPANIIVHLKGDAERQRHLARMQKLRTETAASHMLKVAATLQGGAALNATKGVAPFMAANSTRGMGTVVTGGTPLAGTMIYTPVQPTPRAPAPGSPVMLDPISELRTSLEVLSRTEIEAAWSAAEAVNKALGGNIAQRAEAAAYLLAHVLAEIGNTTKRHDDLADVAAAVESLSMYVTGRMITIVSDLGKADA